MSAGITVSYPKEHARFINTLSYLENCGVKLIARSEHPIMVKKEVLKHAAEEFRHAYFLKAQIEKVYSPSLKSYQLEELLGGYSIKGIPISLLSDSRREASSSGNYNGTI